MAQKPQTIDNPNATVYKNNLAGTGCEKLYLDTRTSDVTFQFPSANSGECIEIPAHKSILSAISPVFDAMFFGPAKELGDVRIVDVTPAAFREFLQFFYLTQVKLSAEHLIDVMNLGKQYMINDCLVACTEFCVATLQLENMCWGYELAILFDLDELRGFCEQKICQHPSEVFRSTSFLNCDVDLLRCILQLEALECDEAMIFDGCIAWAKQACMRNGQQPNGVNALRSQLNDLFYEIRFGEFTHKQFHVRYRLYDGLFSLEEFRDVTMMIASKEFQPVTKFKRVARNANKRARDENDVQICDRKAINHTVWYRVDRCGYSNAYIDKTIFESSMQQQLKQLRCSVKFQGVHVTAKIKISELNDESVRRKSLLYFATIMLSSSEETIIVLPTPINVQPSQKYEIEFELEDGYMYSSELVRSNVRMDNGNIINFSGKQLGMQSLVKAMHFAAINE